MAQEVGKLRKSAPIEIKLYFPKTDLGKRDLAHQVSSVHADFVSTYIQKLNCSAAQKLKLLDSVVSDRRKTTNID